MNTHKTSHTKAAPKRAGHGGHFKNSTDATRGAPLAMRARQRRAELEAAFDATPESQLRARGDIKMALAAVNELLTGDTEHLSEVVAMDLNRWLENTKHLAENVPTARRRGIH